MAALSLISVLLVIMVGASSAHRTTITTVEFDGRNPSSTEKCRQELRTRDLSACLAVLVQPGSRRGGAELKMPESEDQNQQEREILEACCRDLKQVSDDCQCEALKAIAEKDVQVEQVESEQAKQKVEQIRSACGITEPCGGRTIFLL